MEKALVFDFQKLGEKSEKATKEITKILKRGGVMVVSVEASTVKRTSGISYKELNLVANDSQTVTLLIKQTGDIFKVKVNKSELPIKNQDDIKKAVGEILKKLDSVRVAFQRKLARKKAELPKMRSTVVTKEKALTQREAELDQEINKAQQHLKALKAA